MNLNDVSEPLRLTRAGGEVTEDVDVSGSQTLAGMYVGNDDVVPAV